MKTFSSLWLKNGMLVQSGVGEPEFGGGFLRFLFTSLVTMIFAFFVLQTIQQR